MSYRQLHGWILLPLVICPLGAHRYFQGKPASGLRPLYLIGGTAYLAVAVAAFFVDHEQNRINRYYLDIRWPDTFIARNPDAIQNFRGSHLKDLKSKIGPDLAALLNDPGFLDALYHGRFYKQHSDEPFQLINRAVIYSYRPKTLPGQGPSPFVAIRFPKELADAVRFEPAIERYSAAASGPSRSGAPINQQTIDSSSPLVRLPKCLPNWQQICQSR
jgi:hypothetical protein